MKNLFKKVSLLTLVVLMLLSMTLINTTAAGNVNVAKVGNTEYATIDEAIANWTNGTTLTLLTDVTLSNVIQLSSTEHHILDLGRYTMTAASKKDAIQIVNNGRTSASYALDIKADATNPGGIIATGKAVVRTTGKSGVKDRPIIRFYGGVFTGTNVVYHSGSNGTNCPQFWFYGGEFNGTVYANRAKFIFYGGTFNGSLQISVDSNADALIVGGTFKQLSNLYGSSLNTDKFTIGSAAGVYDREVYVDDNGYYVIAAAEPKEGFEASVAKNPGANDYLAYSKVKTEGVLNYTNAEFALKNNTSATVTVYADELDMSGINFKGTIVAPEGHTLTVTNAPEGLKTEGNVKIVNPVAAIDDVKYLSLQAAVNAVKNGETIVLLADIAENVTLTEQVGLSYTIDGNGKNFDGTITIKALSDTNDNRRITIQNIDFVNNDSAARDFITSVEASHYPHLTLKGCTFTGNGEKTDVALRVKSAYDLYIEDCTGTGLHSFLQNTSGVRVTIDNVTVTESKSGLALGTVQGVTVKNCDIDVAGYGIRMDAGYNNNAVIESNTVKAFIPVVVRNASVDSNITFGGANTMTANNTDGYWFVAGTTEYETNGTLPNVPTVKVIVTLNDTALEKSGIYGAYNTGVSKKGTWGGIDWTLFVDGTLVIAPTKGEPVPDKNAPTKRTYGVGEWRETVIYKSNGSASAIGGAPYDMKAVKKLIIEEGVTTIGSFTCQFPNLTGEVVIPSTVTYIGQEAFHKTPITKLTFAAGGTDGLCIANGAFKKTLIEEVAFPGDREYIHIHHWAFGGSTNLKKAYIPANVTKSWGGEHVDYFDNFNSQTNVTWAEYGSMFTGCTAMETITFENEAVRELFFANGRQTTADDYIVAYVGTTAYSTLAAAATNAQSGDIVLVKSVTLSEALVLPADVTLNLNGKTLKGTVAGTVSVNNGLWTTAEGFKMIGKNADYYVSTDAVINVAASLEIVSGNVTLKQSWRTLPGQSITVGASATFVVPADMTFTIYDDTSVIVNGNLTVDGSIILNAGATLFADEGLNVTTNVEDHEVAYNNGVYSVVETAKVAQIGDTQYKTLAEAFAAAQNGDTVVLLSDATSAYDFKFSSGKTYTLDLNGHTWTPDANTIMYNAKLYVIDTVGGGKITPDKHFNIGQNAIFDIAENIAVDFNTVQFSGPTSSVPYYGRVYIGDRLVFDPNGSGIFKVGSFSFATDGLGAFTLKSGTYTLTQQDATLAATNVTVGANANVIIPANTTLTINPETEITINGKVSGDGTIALGAADHFMKAKDKTSIKNIVLTHDVVLAKNQGGNVTRNLTINLNGNNLSFFALTVYTGGTLNFIGDGNVITNTADNYDARLVVSAGRSVNFAETVGFEGMLQFVGNNGVVYIDDKPVFSAGTNALFDITGSGDGRINVSISNDPKTIVIDGFGNKIGKFTLTKDATLAATDVTVGANANVIIPANTTLTINPETKITINRKVSGDGKIVVSSFEHFKLVLKQTEVLNIGLADTINVTEELVVDKNIYVTGANNLVSDGNLKLKAGTYDKNVNEWCADGYCAKSDDDVSWTVSEGHQYVVTINAPNGDNGSRSAACACGYSKTETIYIRLHSLSVSADSLSILNFKFYISDDIYNDVVININGSEVDKETIVYESGRYIISYGVDATNIGVPVVVTFKINGDGNNALIYYQNVNDQVEDDVVTEVSISVANWCDWLGNQSNSKPLASALKEYGACAKTYYSDNNNPADITVSVAADNTQTDDNGGIEVTALALNLNGGVSLKVYFTMPGEYDVELLKPIGMLSGATYYGYFEQEPEDVGNNIYCVTIDNIPPIHLDHEYEIQFTSVVEGQEVKYSIKASVQDWVDIANNSNNSDVKNLAGAVEAYNKAADDYFKQYK